MATYFVYDDQELLTVLRPDDPVNACMGHRRVTTVGRVTIGGELGDLCGGCDACQLMQAQYAGLRVVETTDEAAAR